MEIKFKKGMKVSLIVMKDTKPVMSIPGLTVKEIYMRRVRLEESTLQFWNGYGDSCSQINDGALWWYILPEKKLPKKIRRN